MKKFSDKLTKNFYIFGLAQGNINKETAITTSKMLLDVVKCEPLQPQNFPKVRVYELPIGEYCCRAMSFNENDSNSIITNYYQSDIFSMKTNVILELLMVGANYISATLNCYANLLLDVHRRASFRYITYKRTIRL